jgi:hypothetical protein
MLFDNGYSIPTETFSVRLGNNLHNINILSRQNQVLWEGKTFTSKSEL